MFATKIRMKKGCYYSQDLTEIDQVFVDGCSKPGYVKKEDLHDYLKKNPNTVQVHIFPYPYVIPAISSRGEKYVRSSPNGSTRDNLLNLPRE